MTYQETLDFMYSQLPMYHRIGAAAYKADIQPTIDMMAEPINSLIGCARY